MRSTCFKTVFADTLKGKYFMSGVDNRMFFIVTVCIIPKAVYPQRRSGRVINIIYRIPSDLDNLVPTRSFVIYAVLVNEVFHIRSSIIGDIQPGTCIVHAQEISDRFTTKGIVVFKFRSSI